MHEERVIEYMRASNGHVLFPDSLQNRSIVHFEDWFLLLNQVFM
jgi:hypothetical protein